MITRRLLDVSLVVCVGLVVWRSPPHAWAQLTPAEYQDLFRDSPQLDRLTQADLPNLGRLVVLEATSMFVHARSELSSSPNGFRLLEAIRSVWSAADGFTATVADGPDPGLSLDAGRLSFADLEAAYNQLRGTFAAMPGGAPLAGQNLVNMGRVVAVIGPLLREGETLPPAAPRARVALGPMVRGQAADALRAIGAFRRRIDASLQPGRPRDRLDKELQNLGRLLQGLQLIAEGPASRLDLIASLRPLRGQLQRLDLELQAVGLGTLARGDEWRAIEQRIDALSNRLQLPREIVPPLSAATPDNPRLLGQIDKATGEADRILEGAQGTERSLDERLLLSDTRFVRHRLYLLRQALLGRESPASVSQALRNVERVRAQLADAGRRVAREKARVIEALQRDVDETIRQARQQLSPRT
ncbi:MAG: hypothetical protein U0790_29570 [Isosphaeraceae bacterium]